jgi:hypothetical protein
MTTKNTVDHKDASDLYRLALSIGALDFSLMVTAAGEGEAWAVERVQRVIDQINNCELSRRDAVLAANTVNPSKIAVVAFEVVVHSVTTLRTESVVRGAVDIDITVSIDGESADGRITMLPGASTILYVTLGEAAHWMSFGLLRWLSARMPDRDAAGRSPLGIALHRIEVACCEAAVTTVRPV